MQPDLSSFAAQAAHYAAVRARLRKVEPPRPKISFVTLKHLEPVAVRIYDAPIGPPRFVVDIDCRMPPAIRSKIAGAVARRHRVSVEAMIGPSRLVQIVRARQDAMHAMRFGGYSFPECGRLFKRDHTTAIHAFRKIEALTIAGLIEPFARTDEFREIVK